MFENLSVFPVILVSGVQRSGTAICARMIAHDTKHTYVDEREFGTHDPEGLEQLLEACGEEKKPIVVHCPGVSRWVHEFAGPDVLIVFVIRDLGDTRRSQERIGWHTAEDGGVLEIEKYADVLEKWCTQLGVELPAWPACLPARPADRPARQASSPDRDDEVIGMMNQIRFWYWRTHQRQQVEHWKEIAYNSLERHPLWAPAELRKDFAPRQWKVDDQEW